MKFNIVCLLFILSFIGGPAAAQLFDIPKLQIQELRDEDRYEEALKMVNDEIAKRPGDWDILLLKAHILGDLDRHYEGVEIFDQYLAKYPDDAWILGFRGLYRGILGYQRKSYEDLDRSIQLDPTNAPVYYFRANLKFQRDDVEGAKRDYLSAIRYDSVYSQPHFKLAQIYFEEKKYDSSAYHFDKDLEINPAHETGLYERSYCRLYIKDYKGAYDDVRKLAAMGVEDPFLFWNGGVAAMNISRFKEAEEYFTRLIAHDSLQIKYHLRRSIVRDSLGKYAEGIADISRCITLNDRVADFYVNLANLKLRAKYPLEQVLDEYNKALTLKNGHGRAYYYRGLFYGQHLNDREQACIDLRRARDSEYEVKEEEIQKYCK
jgi:tetratricopeptide (TPR) repeat protein